MFLIKGMEALKKAAIEHLYEESKGCTDEFTTLRVVLQFLMLNLGMVGLILQQVFACSSKTPSKGEQSAC